MIDFSKLDKVIHEKGRLGIVTLLASRVESWPFQDLKAELQMSDGNLIRIFARLRRPAMLLLPRSIERGDPRPTTG